MNLAGNLHQPDNHRSLYLCYLRNSMPPELTAFDLPEFTGTLGKRVETTLPTQSLYLFNSEFMIRLAENYSTKKLHPQPNAEKKIVQAFRDILRREPSTEEIYRGEQLVKKIEENEHSSTKAWAGFTQSLLMTSEFRYIE